MAFVRIPRSEFEHLAPQQPGKLRTQHISDNCLIGSGGSQSLLIERSDYGVSCYCFRCGGRGFYYLDRRFIPRAEGHREPTDYSVTTAGGITLPGDCEAAAEASLTGDARRWLIKGGLLSPVITRYGFLWSPSEEALYIPVQQEISAFGPVEAGWVKRQFNPKTYRTLRKGQKALWGLYRGTPGRVVQGEGGESLVEPHRASESVCLVEDVVSAIRVAETGMDALAMCGVHLPAEAASFILTEGYKRAIIFLDGDNPQVKGKAREAANRLSWMPTRIVETGLDPKLYPLQELAKLLEG